MAVSQVKGKRGPVRENVSDRAFERVLSGIRDGRTLKAVCDASGMPSRAAVLKRLTDSPECEARMLRARRIGVWTQLDTIMERLNTASPTELGTLKELANHVRWLAGKLAADSFSGASVSGRDLIEIRWLESHDTESPPD